MTGVDGEETRLVQDLRTTAVTRTVSEKKTFKGHLDFAKWVAESDEGRVSMLITRWIVTLSTTFSDSPG